MEKPISVTIKEFKAKIETAISESKLPAFIIEPILFNYWMQVKQQADVQADADERAYMKSEGKEED